MLFALQAGSVAVDAGANSASPTVDQRGAARPLDGDNDGTARCRHLRARGTPSLPLTGAAEPLSGRRRGDGHLSGDRHLIPEGTLRVIRTFILRLLVNSAEPEALRGDLRPLPEGEAQTFPDEQALLASPAQ